MNDIKLFAVGDILLQARSNKHPFDKVKKTFKDKDILFGNLETALSGQGKREKKAFPLYSPSENVKYLKDVDYDVLNIANNHILDRGVEGFNNTLEVLNKNDLNFIGANNDKSISNHLILEKRGMKFGFLGYTTGRFKIPSGICINKLSEKKILADIESIKNKCDFVIISLHWGTENVFYPSPNQIDLAHNLIDNGATLILGHHPHVIQGVEEYKDGLIVYSLGNFQFRPRLSQSKTSESIILCVDFNMGGIKKYEIIPVGIDNELLPKLVEGQKKNEMLNYISDLSQMISSSKITEKWWYEEIAEEYLSNHMNSYRIRIKKYGIFPLVECAVWLITPFCIRCYAGIIRQKLKHSRKVGK